MTDAEPLALNEQAAISERYYRDLTGRALAGASVEFELRAVEPSFGSGWVLVFAVGERQSELRIDVGRSGSNTLCNSAFSGFSYRDPRSGDPVADRVLADVGVRICELLAGAESVAPPPELAAAPHGPTPKPQKHERPRRPAEYIELRGSCDRACLFCGESYERAVEQSDGLSHPDRRGRSGRGPREAFPASMLRPLYRRGLHARLREVYARTPDAVVHWNGNDALNSSYFTEATELAYDLGFRDMQLQTPGGRLVEDGVMEHLAACSITKINLTAHGASPEVFDFVNGKQGGHELFWRGLELSLQWGLEVFVAVPCIAHNVHEIAELLPRLAGHDVGIEVFFWSPDAPYRDGFQAIGCSLESAGEALSVAAESLAPRRVSVTGIPQCAVPEAIADHYYWSFERCHHVADASFRFADSCASCTKRSDCAGLPIVYLEKFPAPTPITRA